MKLDNIQAYITPKTITQIWLKGFHSVFAILLESDWRFCNLDRIKSTRDH